MSCESDRVRVVMREENGKMGPRFVWQMPG
jgi:hypothetical protein